MTDTRPTPRPTLGLPPRWSRDGNIYRYEHRIVNGSVHSHDSGDVVVYGPYAIFSHGNGHVRSDVISIDQLDQWAHDLTALARYLRALEAK